MPTLTQTNDKEAKAAKKAEALLRAKQWRDEKREAKSPATKTAPKSSSKKKSAPASKPPTLKRTPNAKKAAATEEEDVPTTAQYRKTPSKEARATARAKARASAREWRSHRKKKVYKVVSEAKVEVQEVAGVPSVVQTNDANDVEDLSASDDFKTAKGTEAQTTGISMSMTDAKALTFLKNDVKNAYNRLQSIVDNYANTIEDMDCD